MICRFIRENLQPGLILGGRDPHGAFGKLIRAVLGSYTNHNGLIVRTANGGFAVAEAVSPVSKVTPLDHYEAAMAAGYVVRIWRANAGLRALPLKAGRYDIEFTYRPLSVRIGSVLSTLCALALLLIGIGPALLKQRVRRLPVEEHQ